MYRDDLDAATTRIRILEEQLAQSHEHALAIAAEGATRGAAEPPVVCELCPERTFADGVIHGVGYGLLAFVVIYLEIVGDAGGVIQALIQ